MKKIILLTAAGLILSGCGSVHKVISDTKKTADSADVKRSSAKSDSAAISTATVQRTKTTTATIDTTVTTNGDSLAGGVQLDTESKQPQTNTIESGGMKIETEYDPTTGKLHVKATAKPQSIPVQMHTQTVEQNNEQNSSSVAVTNQDATEHQVTTSTTVETHDKEVKRTAPFFIQYWWLWLLIAAGGAYYVWKKHPTVWSAVTKFVLP